MNDSKDLTDRLDQLGRELGSQPSVIPQVMNRVNAVDLDSLSQDAPRPSIPERNDETRHAGRQRFWQIALIGLAACLLLAAGISLTRPNTLYAKAMVALSRAQTIHVTGWSKRVPRAWPLESPREEADANYPVEMWFWRSVDGTPRTFERYGPVTKILIGTSEKEYQKDVDLLYLAEGRTNDDAEEIATLAKLLAELKDTKQEDLGTKSVDGFPALP